MAKFLDVTSSRTFSAALWEFLRRTRPADQPAVASLRRAEKTLTDAQIKALPGTPIIIVPAPAAGYMIYPTSALLIAKFAGGLYEDELGSEGVDGYLVLTTDVTKDSSFPLISPVSATTAFAAAVDAPIMMSAKESTAASHDGFFLTDYAAKPLSVALAERISTDPLVGGHINNTLTAICYYDIVPV